MRKIFVASHKDELVRLDPVKQACRHHFTVKHTVRPAVASRACAPFQEKISSDITHLLLLHPSYTGHKQLRLFTTSTEPKHTKGNKKNIRETQQAGQRLSKPKRSAADVDGEQELDSTEEKEPKK